MRFSLFENSCRIRVWPSDLSLILSDWYRRRAGSSPGKELDDDMVGERRAVVQQKGKQVALEPLLARSLALLDV
jgi:hypothetical protein